MIQLNLNVNLEESLNPSLNNVNYKKNLSSESISGLTLTPNSEDSLSNSVSPAPEFENSFNTIPVFNTPSLLNTSQDHILNNLTKFYNLILWHHDGIQKPWNYGKTLKGDQVTVNSLSKEYGLADHIISLSNFNAMVPILLDGSSFLSYWTLTGGLNQNLIFLIDVSNEKDLSSTLKTLNLGTSCLISSSPQQDYDYSIIISLFALKGYSTTLLYNNGKQSWFTGVKINTLSDEQLLELFKQVEINNFNSLDEVMNLYYNYIGRSFNKNELLKYNEFKVNTLIISLNLPNHFNFKEELIYNNNNLNYHILTIQYINDLFNYEYLNNLINLNGYQNIIFINYNSNSIYYGLFSTLISKVKIYNLIFEIGDQININLLNIIQQEIINSTFQSTFYIKDYQLKLSQNELNLKILKDTSVRFQFLIEGDKQPNYLSSLINNNNNNNILNTFDSIGDYYFNQYDIILNNKENELSLKSKVDYLILDLKDFYKLPLSFELLKENYKEQFNIILLYEEDMELNFELLLNHLNLSEFENCFNIFKLKKDNQFNNEFNGLLNYLLNNLIKENLFKPINSQYKFNESKLISINTTTTNNSNNNNNEFIKLNLQPNYFIQPEKRNFSEDTLLKIRSIFNKQFNSSFVHRPDIENVNQIKLIKKERLTPLNYNRNIFHLEFESYHNELKYEIGDALGVYPRNSIDSILPLIKKFNLNAYEIVEWYQDKDDDNNDNNEVLKYYINGYQLLTQYLDVFGKPNRDYYKGLAKLAKDEDEKKYLLEQGDIHFIKNQEDFITYYDLLIESKSIEVTFNDLINLIPKIEPRHYSIASSNKMHPNQVHLLVVKVNWESSRGSRTGLATRYLDALELGDLVTVNIKPSVMRLPPNHLQPVIMAGLGTGMAPFRAFIEERYYLQQQGVKVGPMALYFGSRSRNQEYLYGEELDYYHQLGLVQQLRLAFSRDQPNKVYIQHLMVEDSNYLNQWINEYDAHFYLCGPTWPELEVRMAIAKALSLKDGMNEEMALRQIEQLKEEEKYVLELY